MGILKKVKSLVGVDDTKEEKPKAKRAPAAKKKIAEPTAIVEAAHDHAGHDHRDHAHEETAPATTTMAKPQSIDGATQVGATKYILRPLITEKGTYAAANNTYMFAVLPHASKPAIKQAIEKLYSVRVIKIRTSRYDGKKVRSGRIEGQRSNFKKAFVTVAQGQSIALHKGV